MIVWYAIPSLTRPPAKRECLAPWLADEHPRPIPSPPQWCSTRSEENAAQDVRATLSVRRSSVPDRGLARPVPTPSAPERGTGEDGGACLLLFESVQSFAVYLQAGAYRGRA